MRIRHVVPLLDGGAPDDLHVAQDVALASILQAREFAAGSPEVSVVGASFPDEPTPDLPLTVRPTLLRSARDVVPGGVNRRLPLLADVLAALGDPDEYDVAVFTNADIAVQPHFYRAVAALADTGIDAGSITRRTVSMPTLDLDALTWGSMAEGQPHPGHDCLFFESSLAPDLDVGGVTLGAANVMRPMLASLFVRSRDFRVLHDLHLTFHLEDAQDWQDRAYDPNAVYNSEEVVAVLGRLSNRYGRESVVRFLHAEGFQPHPDAVVPVELIDLIREGRPRPPATPSLGARLDQATKGMPRVNGVLHRATSALRGTRA